MQGLLTFCIHRESAGGQVREADAAEAADPEGGGHAAPLRPDAAGGPGRGEGREQR